MPMPFAGSVVEIAAGTAAAAAIAVARATQPQVIGQPPPTPLLFPAGVEVWPVALPSVLRLQRSWLQREQGRGLMGQGAYRYWDQSAAKLPCLSVLNMRVPRPAAAELAGGAGSMPTIRRPMVGAGHRCATIHPAARQHMPQSKNHRRCALRTRAVVASDTDAPVAATLPGAAADADADAADVDG